MALAKTMEVIKEGITINAIYFRINAMFIDYENKWQRIRVEGYDSKDSAVKHEPIYLKKYYYYGPEINTNLDIPTAYALVKKQKEFVDATDVFEAGQVL